MIADKLRSRGWMVGVHNDYRLHGEFHTFWLFTKGDRCVKGEGRSDEEALAAVERAVLAIEGKPDHSRPSTTEGDLREENAKLREENTKLRATLAWYADVANYVETTGIDAPCEVVSKGTIEEAWIPDQGMRARRTLGIEEP